MVANCTPNCNIEYSATMLKHTNNHLGGINEQTIYYRS